jgi:succinoglycan biosynthesis protein ExoO
VILPAYNASEYIRAAVRSALNQTLQELEVILVDDASDDSTISAALDAAGGDTRLVVIRCEINGGPSVARNIGIDRAKGNWVALLDADDTFAPERLELLLQLANASAADLMTDNMMVTTVSESSNGKPALPLKFMSLPGPISAGEFVAWDRPAHGLRSVGFMKPLMRTEFLRANNIRYDSRFRIGQDFHFYVQCLLAGAKLHVSPNEWYQYLYRSDSQSRGLESKRPEQLIESNEDLERLAIQWDDKDALIELRERREDLRKWIPYLSFVALLRDRRMLPALKQFLRLPSRSFALRGLLYAGLRRISLTSS